jgi:hypothetical protein
MTHSSFDPDTLGTSGPECDRYLDQLSLLDSDFLSVDERAAVREHLASCAACRARLAAFAPVDAALHRYVDWLRGEAAQSSTWLAEDDVMHLAHEHTNHLRVPVDPSLDPEPRPRTRSRHSSPNRYFTGLAAIVAVLLIALSATIFVLLANARRSPPGRVTQSPVCAPNQISAHLPKGVRLADVAMISADEGWLVGDVPDAGTSGPVLVKPLLLHYQHCQWTQEPITLSGVGLYRISAVSARDVWVLGIKESLQKTTQGVTTMVLTSLALHYTGGQWQVTPFPVTISHDQDIMRFTMVSSTEGWIEVGQRTQLGADAPYQLYHGVNGVWSLVSAPGYQHLLPIRSFASGATWLTADDSATNRLTLLLYHDGALMPMYTLPAYTDLSADDQIHMDSPQSAWIAMQLRNGRGAQTGWLLLQCSLSSCRQSSLVNDPRIQMSDMVQVFSATEGWAFSMSQQGAPPGIESAFHLQNGHWQSVPWPFQQIEWVSVIVQIGPDEYWALTNSSVLHFVNGAWSSYS